ncbi:MAG: type II secretion system protein [Alphaproteobacteria bacterium]|nr:type II secretion system protein [Alphaproteobacteria bacterium]
MKKDLQNGRSMIEMLGVLSIIGILTVGGFSLVSKTVSENKINKVIDEVSDLARRSRVVFREYIYDNKTGTDMTKYLYDAKAYPTDLEWNESGSKFIDDEDIEMKVLVMEKSAVKYYVLEVAKVSEEICMGIANGQWGTMSTNGFSGIAFSKDDSVGGSIDLGTAASTCADGKTLYLAFR